jgi:hypothetical protein
VAVGALTRRDLDRFLRTLAGRLPCRATLVLTGGSQAMLLGGTRPTADIDFGLSLAGSDAGRWLEVEALVGAAARDSGVAVQFAEDVDRWSSVSIPPGRRRTRSLGRLGRLSVRLLDPRCWAVYKLARYLQPDVEDLVAVLRRERVPWASLARLCGESLRSSPRSTQLRLFRGQVEHFFAAHGRAVWGARFEPERAIGAFRRAAGIPA